MFFLKKKKAQARGSLQVQGQIGLKSSGSQDCGLASSFLVRVLGASPAFSRAKITPNLLIHPRRLPTTSQIFLFIPGDHQHHPKSSYSSQETTNKISLHSSDPALHVLGIIPRIYAQQLS